MGSGGIVLIKGPSGLYIKPLSLAGLFQKIVPVAIHEVPDGVVASGGSVRVSLSAEQA